MLKIDIIQTYLKSQKNLFRKMEFYGLNNELYWF